MDSQADPADANGAVVATAASVNTTRSTLAGEEAGATEAPSSGLLHPALGYLVCVAVLLTFGVCIGVICFRHYRRKKGASIAKLPHDHEALVSFEPVPDKASEEPVKTVVFKRNGKDVKMKGGNVDDEVTPMLSSLQDSEPLSESIAVELIKYTKKTDDLPMIDEGDETEMDRADGKVAEGKKDAKDAPVTATSSVVGTAGHAAQDTGIESGGLGHTSPERETLTESQVLEILDDAENNNSEENSTGVEVTADVHPLTGDRPPPLPTTPPPMLDLPNTSSFPEVSDSRAKNSPEHSKPDLAAGEMNEQNENTINGLKHPSAVTSGVPNDKAMNNSNNSNNKEGVGTSSLGSTATHLHKQDHTTHM